MAPDEVSLTGDQFSFIIDFPWKILISSDCVFNYFKIDHVPQVKLYLQAQQIFAFDPVYYFRADKGSAVQWRL